ncbi:hypothetical protein B0H14DRAFT_2625356 [Mycena olivaceomarginata]|nr:hypothetical protein B0H14DRAFT_2625356 [Mycena olivaceomarginata]
MPQRTNRQSTAHRLNQSKGSVSDNDENTPPDSTLRPASISTRKPKKPKKTLTVQVAETESRIVELEAAVAELSSDLLRLQATHNKLSLEHQSNSDQARMRRKVTRERPSVTRIANNSESDIDQPPSPLPPSSSPVSSPGPLLFPRDDDTEMFPPALYTDVPDWTSSDPSDFLAQLGTSAPPFPTVTATATFLDEDLATLFNGLSEADINFLNTFDLASLSRPPAPESSFNAAQGTSSFICAVKAYPTADSATSGLARTSARKCF